MDTNWILSRKQLLLRDGLSFLLLSAATIVLFLVTLFLFRSFTAHRAELAQRWAGRGQIALNTGRPEEAIAALETALEYAPGVRANQLMLAQALSAAGHTEQATNYFLNLWETQPGDGPINLQLARLERRRHDKQAKQEAIHYYRAAIYGTWEGDGVVHRRDVRLELANYLIDERDFQTAETELLIAASNAPAEPGLEIGFGDELLRAGDRSDAMRYYQKAIRLAPRNPLALDKAGRLAFAMGDYSRARGWLERAVRDSAGAPGSVAKSEEEDDIALLHRTERLLSLSPDHAPNERESIERLVTASGLAQRRLSACETQLQTTGAASGAGASKPGLSQPRSSPLDSSQLDSLTKQWAAAAPPATRHALIAALGSDDARRNTITSLVYDTEIVTAQLCGPPIGDDALLLLLAGSPHAQGAGSNSGQEP